MSCHVRPVLPLRLSRLTFSLLVFAVGSLLLPSQGHAATCNTTNNVTTCTGGGITLSSSTGASVGSSILVSGVPGTVTAISVTFNNLDVTGGGGVNSIAAVLVSPGAALDLFSGVCNVGSSTFTLADSGDTGTDEVDGLAPYSGSGATCPSALSGTYLPSDWFPGTDVFNSPGPSSYNSGGAGNACDNVAGGPCGTSDFTSTFGLPTATDMNGTWTLYIANQATPSGTGSLESWSISFTTESETATTTSLTPAPTPNGSTSLVYTSKNVNGDTTSATSVTLTATVSPNPGGGSVTFYDSTGTVAGAGTPLASNIGVSGGTAQTNVTFASEGNRSVSAVFSGTSSYASSTSTVATVLTTNHPYNPSGATFCNGPITLNDNATDIASGGAATPYPSLLALGTGFSQLSGTIESVTVSLNNVSLPDFGGFPNAELADLGFLLQAPGTETSGLGSNGNAFEFLSWAGNPYQSGSLTISDTGNSEIPYNFGPSCSTCLPTDNYVDVSSGSFDSLPSPATQTPDKAAPTGSSTFLTEFGGQAANNTWSLYVADRIPLSTPVGSIGEWCLNFTMQSGADATTTSVSGSPNPASFSSGSTASVTLTANVLDSSNSHVTVNAGTVTFVDGTTTLGAQPVSNGQATLTAALGEGTHQIRASYSGTNSGSPEFGISTGKFDQRVDKATTNPATGTGSTFSYCNTGAITAPGLGEDAGAAYPYPSNIFVTNLPGTVEATTVTLKGFNTKDQGDLMSLLVGPTTNSNKWINNFDFFSLTGSSVTSPSTFNLTFADGGTNIGGSNLESTGTYAPESNENLTFPQCGQNASDCGTENVGPPLGSSSTFTPSNKAQPAGNSAIFGNASTEGVFGGTTGSTYIGNGTWSLYLDDGGPLGGGEDTNVTNGWCVNFTENLPAGSVDASHNSGPGVGGAFVQGQGAQLTVSITNNGPGPTGDPTQTGNPLTMTDVLPDMTFTGTYSGTGWTCTGTTTITCKNENAIAQGSSYPELTLNVTVSSGPSVPTSVSNQATISGAGINSTTSLPDNITILAATTTTASNASAMYSSAAQSVTLAATVTSTGGTVNTGTVTFTVVDASSNVIGSPITSGTVTNGSASASFTLPMGTAPGTYTIDATYNPGTGFNGSSDNTHMLTVNPASTTTTASSASATYTSNPQSVALSATITSSGGTVNGGTVTFAVVNASSQVIGSSTTSGTVANGSASVTYTLPAGTAPGTYTIEATYNPGTDFAGSSDNSHALTVNRAGTTAAVTVFDSTSGLPWGGAETAGAAAFGAATVSPGSSGTPTGSVTYNFYTGTTCLGTPIGTSTEPLSSGSVPNSNPVGPIGAGTYSLSASYSGDSDFLGSSSSCAVFVVNQAATSTSVTSNLNPSNFGQSVVLTATIALGYAPSGTVGFTSNGTPITNCTAAPVSSGTAQCVTASLLAGNDAIVAMYSGDSNNNASQGSLSGGQQVTPPYLVVTTPNDDTGPAQPSNCSPQTAPGTGTDSACSLRDALLFAANAGGGNISFNAATFASTNSALQNTITLGSDGTLTIPNNTAIAGATSGSGATLANLVTVSGGNSVGVFNVNSGATTILNNLIVANGTSSSGGSGLTNAGTTTIASSAFTGNQATGGAAGGAVTNTGTLTVTGSTFSNNSTTGGGNGGAIESTGTLTITNSTISGNSVDTGADGGGIENGGTLTLTNSTVSGNNATGSGAGGGIFNNSTATLANSIVAGNTASADPDLTGAFTDGGHNLIGDGTGMSGITNGANGDMVGTSASPINPELAPLSIYGGPTQTMVPLPGSGAICGGLASIDTGAGITTDQRGFRFLSTYCPAGFVDAGAVQTNYLLTFGIEPPPTVPVGVAITPAPTVVLDESLAPMPAASTSIMMTDADSLLSISSTLTQNLASGTATFNSLIIGSPSASDALTAKMALTSSINLTTTSNTFAAAVPALTLAKTDTGGFVQGGTAEWDITVGNSVTGSITTGTITVSDALPTGYTLASSIGGIFSCSGTTTVTCTTTTGIPVGSPQTIKLTVNVPAASPTSVTNTAQAWGGGDPVHTSGNPVQSSDTVAVAQVPATLTLLGSSTQSATVGTAFTSATAYGPLAVTVTDAGGVPVPAYSGTSFLATVGISGGTGTFTGGSSTVSVITDGNGVADPGAFTANTIADTYTVGVSLGGLSATYNMTNTPDAFFQIAVSSPSQAFIGWPIYTSVTAEDQYGNTVTSFPDTVHVTSTDPAAVLPPDSTLLNGFGIFSAILNTATTSTPTTFTVTDTNPSNPIAGTSNPIFVLAPPVLVVTTAADGPADDSQCTDQSAPGAVRDTACSLRDALNFSSSFGAAAISFDSTKFTSPAIIALTNGVLEIPNDTSITGLSPGTITVSGNSAGGVFQMTDPNAQGSINNLTITGGLLSDPTPNALEQGAGIYNNGTLTVTNSTISGNSVSAADPTGEADGGGIYSDNDLEISNSTITNNTASSGGLATAGGIVSLSYMDATNVTVSGNSVSGNTDGEFVMGGGIFTSDADIFTSTITGNSVQGPSDGNGSPFGGGIVEDGLIHIDYSTIQGNSAAGGASGVGGGILILGGSQHLRNSTITGNTSDGVAGGMAIGSASAKTYNTILSGNAAVSNPDLDDPGLNLSNLGGNLIGVSGIKLTALGNYGGPTQTVLPLPGSPAICDGVPANIPFGFTTDQRGVGFPNTTLYAAYSSTPCADSGAVQTNYTIEFTTLPPAEAAINLPFTPAPTIGLLESGVPLSLNSGTVVMSDSSGQLAGILSENLNAGSAAFNDLTVPLLFSGDTLTATLPLNSPVITTVQAATTTNIVEPTAATLSSPTPNVGTALGTNPTFTWTGGIGVKFYELNLGTTGAGSNDLFNSGNLPATATGVTVTGPGLPSNGVIVYARLHSWINGAWQSHDYTYLEPGTATAATLTSPTPNVGTALGTNPTFAWTGGIGVAFYELNLGTTGAGSNDLFNSGYLPATATGVTVTGPGLPSNGVIVYARLHSWINGAWQSHDYTYLEPGTATAATLTSPTPNVGTALGTNPTFAWTGGIGVAFYELNLGTTGAGSNDLFNSGYLPATATGVTVTGPGLPSNGVIVYARLHSWINGAWQSHDYTYLEPGTATAATLSSPTPNVGTALGTNPTFAWTGGIGVAFYELNLGTTGAGSNDLFNSGYLPATATGVTVTGPGLPSNGVIVYARLHSWINGAWQSHDYTYLEPGSPTLPQITFPAPNSVLTGSSVTFTWDPGVGPTQFQLKLGTSPGSLNVYNGAITTGTSEAVTGIPTNSGVKIYARLYYYLNGTWQHVDSTYTEQ